MNKTNQANLNRFKSWLNRTCREVMCDDETPFYENNKHYAQDCSSPKDEFINLLGDSAFWSLVEDNEAPNGKDNWGISNDILYAEEQINIAFEKACV
jgi:hypothetical protein|tara:strand:+ start:300 stop:590 length:291 start_codon:yes stop_codon:yes gene_type:complete